MLMQLIAGPLLQNRMRVALSLLAIALGVSLGYAVQLINRAAVDEFGNAVQTLSGESDLTVRGSRRGFDDTVYPLLATQAEVAVASPMLDIDGRLDGRNDRLRIIGLDVFQAARVQPQIIPEASDRMDTLRGDTIFLSPAAMQWRFSGWH